MLTRTFCAGEHQEAKYNFLSDAELPLTESLAHVVKRFMPLWNDTLVPEIKKGMSLNPGSALF